MALKDFDFDLTLGNLVEMVQNTLKQTEENNLPNFEWLAGYEASARQKLKGTSSGLKAFKMPKTPARKKTRQQKKRVLNEDDDQMNDNQSNDVPLKKGKLSNEEDELRESIGGRPRRQASNAAKSKIQQSLKMTLKQKLRRPSSDHSDASNTSTIQESDMRQHQPMECSSPVLPKNGSKKKASETITPKSDEVTSPPAKTSVSTKTETTSVSFKPEAINVSAEKPKVCFDLETSIPRLDATRDISCATVDIPEEPVDQEEPSIQEEVPAAIPEPVAVIQNDPPKPKGRPRRIKKAEEAVVEKEMVVEAPPVVETHVIEDSLPIEEKEAKRPSIEPEVIPKKKTRKIRKPVEEKAVAAAVTTTTTASPRPIRTQKPRESIRSSPVPIAQNSPRLEKTPSKRNLQLQFAASNSSPVRKVFTPKLVFSPFKASSVKTKVEAFEAALGTVPGSASAPSKNLFPVLPEARVLLKRLTDQELKDAGADEERPSKPTQATNAKQLDGTFVLDAPDETDKKAERRSIAQILARKSVDKAKHIALAAARNKHINSVVHNETAESPNIHVNKNAANIMSKFRFASGSSGSSSSSLNRYVSMTQGKAHSNVVTGVGTFTGTKPVGTMPTKTTEEDEIKRKEHELKRLKEKEEEAARKRDELIKAKAEEQKRKHEARAKRAMEQRMLRAKQLGDEQKQKLENKEEKSAHLKQKLLAENQERAEKVRADLLRRQHEAEQRRKAEEQQKQQEWEEEQQRLQAIKKEQEELEKLAKLRQAEAEKAKAAAPTAPAAAPLNTTVTLPSSSSADNYQITPVRVTKMGKIFNPDNYDIADMRSDDSTDDDSRPKKTIPSWARSANLKGVLAYQAKELIDTDEIFPPEALLKDPNLNEIFKIKRARFNKRTSSAVWKTPPANFM